MSVYVLVCDDEWYYRGTPNYNSQDYDPVPVSKTVTVLKTSVTTTRERNLEVKTKEENDRLVLSLTSCPRRRSQ